MTAFAPITRRAAVAMTIAASLSPAALASVALEGPPPLSDLSGQYMVVRPTRHVGAVLIRTATGDVVELSRFAGRVVLLNFWATWCAPCVREMPSLDRLAARAPADLAVVPVSLDEEGCPAVVRFYREHRLAHLGMYFNVEGQSSYGRGRPASGASFALYGLPISYVIDKASLVRGYIVGAVEWDSDEAAALLRCYARATDG